MAGKLLWTGTVSFAVDFYSFYPLYPAGELTYICILMWMDLLPQTNLNAWHRLCVGGSVSGHGLSVASNAF